jgi:hypothetical protein
MFKRDIINFRGHAVMVKLGEYSFWLESEDILVEVDPAHEDTFDNMYGDSVTYTEPTYLYSQGIEIPTWLEELAGQIEAANYDPKSGRRNGRI